MTTTAGRVSPEGFTVLHETATVEADIVFIHGIQGHPYDTWTRRRQIPNSKAEKQRNKRRNDRSSQIWNCFACGVEENSVESEDEQEDPVRHKPTANLDVYWPRDFLSKEDWCQTARILAYGYDSKVTKGYEKTNKNNLFSHAKDLLYALQREKPARRPVLFVVHSLGGIILKEVLRRSEDSEEDAYKDIVRSTKGIIFLGTPHRGSPGLANLAETVRQVVSMIARVDTHSALLRTLGTDSPELELGRESFPALWRMHNFQVKTFQEAYGIAGVNVGPLNGKVVPDTSSTLDDPREHSETISANHMDMCRFTEPGDPGYRKVSAEIKKMLLSGQQDPQVTDEASEMYDRQKNIHRALLDTCDWLFRSPEYVSWTCRSDVQRNRGLLWIKGKPGAGKSTLMKRALNQAQARYAGSATSTAAFFFNARGTQALEKSSLGLYRALLHQILQQDLLALSHLSLAFKKKQTFQSSITWHEEELQEYLVKVFATSSSRPAVLFIDAMDECCDEEVRDLVKFFSDLSRQAVKAGARLDVCFSSRHYPHISIEDCSEVVVEHHNRQDILLYVSSEAMDNKAIQELKEDILVKSDGVFLWVALVVAILKKSGHGKSLKWLRQKLSAIPAELETLFKQLFTNVEEDDILRIVHLMQMMLFSIYPLDLDELHAALAFTSRPFATLQEWTNSIDYLETDRQRHEMIVELSRGLLETAPTSKKSTNKRANKTNEDSDKVTGTQTYQFIHETVREFFLSGQGFQLLKHSKCNVVGHAHKTLAAACVRFISVRDLPLDRLSKLEKLKEKSKDEPSLLYYARHFLFDHIESTEANHISLEEHLRLIEERHLLDIIILLNRREHWISQGANLMYAAAEIGAIHIVERLHNMGYGVNVPCSAHRRYPLLAAVGGKSLWDKTDTYYRTINRVSCPELVQWFIEHGADISLTSDEGQTALHIAAMMDTDTVKVIMAQKPQINAQNNAGDTPLHLAMGSDEPERMIQLLIQHGADASLANRRRQTAMFLICEAGYMLYNDGLVRRIASSAKLSRSRIASFTASHRL
ncbi:hypothetical protein GGR57DRAFT_498426 [Xylariaceae sp. FL1272]|nr:hypothetical protein GGR57DRAFT_498426 [Xylariaceae sp. FL1272]